MARIPRMVITGEPTVYHIISRTALDGFVLGDVEKDYLLELVYSDADSKECKQRQ